ncbi:FecR family protein [Spirosoma harenae]
MITPNEFASLLNRYKNGQCSDEEIKLIDSWYEQLGKEHQLLMNEAERLEIKKKLWQAIDQQTNTDEEEAVQETRRQIPFPVIWRWVAAAAIVILVGIGAFITYRLQNSALSSGVASGAAESGIIAHTNTTDKLQQIALTDGSLIQLQPHSSIRYTTSLKSPKRETWLTGKAFFQVRRNPARPFLVYSGKVATRVLGTSFWVTAPTNAQTVEVAVQTGKVAVFKQKDHSGNLDEKTNEEAEAVITPNQKVTIFVEQNRVARGLIEEPKPIRSANQVASVNFSFDASPLPEVLNRLEKEYGIEMRLGNKALEACRFTGNITQQPLYSKLELLCQAINARYEIQGPRIIINGAGCMP